MDQTFRVGQCPKCGGELSLMARFVWESRQTCERQLKRLELSRSGRRFHRAYRTVEVRICPPSES